MKNRKLSQWVAAGLLAAVLGVPGIARAEGGREAGSIGAWEWLVSLWEEGVSALWSGSEKPPQPEPGVGPGEGEAGSETDQGLGVDPNGGG
jgi:hypothetical protein